MHAVMIVSDPSMQGVPAGSSVSRTNATGPYRPGLATRELIEEVGALRKQRLVIDRLLCRYLADLADQFGRSTHGPRGAGYGDVFEVAERVLGLGTRPTRERIRVGRALRELPRIEQALESGAISFARAREITRVARREDETTWLSLGRILKIRELQRRVAEASGRKAGRSPRVEEPATPGDDTVRVVLDLPVSDWILLQQALQIVRDGAPRVLTDAEAVTVLARRGLGDRRNALGDGTLPDVSAETVGAVGPAAEEPKECCSERHGAARLTETEDLPERHGAAEPAVRASKLMPMGRVQAPDSTSHDPAGSCVTTQGDSTSDDPAGSRVTTQGDSTLLHAARLLQQVPRRSRWSVDDLCAVTGLSVSAVLTALLELELQGTVRRDWAGYVTYAA